MNSLLILASISSWLPTLPSFDWNAALVVGAIVAVGAVLVIAIAIATPVVAIQGGATLLGTAFTVTCIGVVTGTIAAGAAGFYWGRAGDLKRAEVLEQVMKVSNQYDIYFEPKPGDPLEAKSLSCVLVKYVEQGLDTKTPGVLADKLSVKKDDADEFYKDVEARIQSWLNERKKADGDKRPRRIQFFMQPYPGETFYERIKAFCEKQGCVVTRTNGGWVSALDR